MTALAPATPYACAGGCDPLAPDDPAEAAAAARAWWRIGAGTVLAANAMTLSLAINVSEAGPAARLWVHLGLLAMTLAALALLGGPLAREAWAAARARRLTIEALFLAGLGGALAASLIDMATGVGAVYFETVIILLVVYALGRQAGQSSRRRALRALTSRADAPAECTVLENGAARALPVGLVRPGMVVRVEPGRPVPVDGIIEQGRAFIQESHWTGEFFAAARGPGDRLHAGSHVLDALLLVRATAPGDARRIDRLARAIERARARPSSLQTEADRLVRWFLPIVLLVAGATMFGWTWAAGWHVGLFNAMAVLLIACPCAMGFATPVAVWAAVARLAEQGLVARGGDLVEKLATIDTVVFDKTGTLTQPRATLADLVLAPEVDPESLRRLVAAVERASDHPLAAAFTDLATDVADVRLLELRPLPGIGIEALAALEAESTPARLCIGSEALLDPHPDRWQPLLARLAPLPGARRILIELDGRPAAAAQLEERTLELAGVVMSRLAGDGLRVLVMTGDAAERAGRLGVEFHAGLTPEAKQRLVDEMTAAGRRVLFVGDGINDAAAMTAAHGSVAVAGAAPLAAECADAVLVEGSGLDSLPDALAIGRRAVRTIRTNLRLAAGYNATGMALAAAGLLHPVAAALLMTLSSLVVTWRSLQMLEDEPTPGDAPHEPVHAAP